MQVDHFGTKDSFQQNAILEFERNQERYSFLRWGQSAFQDFRAVPPDTGIVHQVNLEYLAPVVFVDKEGTAYPDTVVGTDSHTTMINGLGVVGWGVGGIEAEACMLGQPATMLLPEVVGFKMTGKLPEGTTATDLVLTATQMLRKKGVVGKFVEFYGEGLAALSLADRATIANMAPEYGATIGVFPIDEATLEYLRLSNRPPELIELVEAYAREQGLFRLDGAPEPVYNDTLSLDLATVVPSLAGPKRPQDRINLPDVKKNFLDFLGAEPKKSGEVSDGSVVIAAITSCTNTSNPSVMIAAGLVAKKAVAAGLKVKPWVKPSLAPGSKVVMDYLTDAGVVPALDALKFNLVGYGCTTCIGNSGPLPEEVAAEVTGAKLTVASVLSGNRNFEGRVNPLVKANYLASPPLVVAYALAGRVDLDLATEAIGQGTDGKDVFLKDIWPTTQEVQDAVKKSVRKEMFAKQYGEVFKGDAMWAAIKVPAGDRYAWDDASDLHQEGSVLRQRWSIPRRTSRISRVFRRWPCSAIRSPPITSPLQATSRRMVLRRSISCRSASKPADFNSYGAPPRQPRSHDARNAREHSSAQSDGSRHRRRLDQARSDRRADDDLRCFREVSGRRVPLLDHRGQGIRHRLFARLGREGRAAARRARL